MTKHYIYTGKGSKIYNSRLLTNARKKAKSLSLLKSSGYQAFITSSNLNNVIETYFKGKKLK